ncbi:hypothetical protein CTI12_AA355460 [Artemisia annua]|uniref:Ulp1 protease family, C-terminal catalytic domain-containing protein n=1 Tax=Artemisia annua TaxID=35608 RepID=A0A2U1MPU3_ARTAN|nr:hypothetical protein CTI12_AA355460 [Artemisia annua]
MYLIDENANKAVKRETGALAKRKKVDTNDDENGAVQKVKRKNGESSKAEGSKPYVFQTRTSPKMLFNALQTLKLVQKACPEQMGFRGLLDMKLDGIPSKIGFYVVDLFNPERMEITLRNSCIMITKQLIGEMLGIRNEVLDIMDEDIEKDEGLIASWLQQFQEGKDKTTGILKGLIRKSKVADMNLKLNFIVLFTSVMGGVKGKGICDLSVLNHIDTETDLSTINWCEYVLRCLQTCKEGWNKEMSNNYFLGPFSLLTMAYADGTVYDRFNVTRIRPPLRFWTYELLKERKQKRLMQEVWAWQNCKDLIFHVVIYMEDEQNCGGYTVQRQCFEKTLDASLGMFPGNLLITNLSQQNRATLLITKAGEESTRVSYYT